MNREDIIRMAQEAGLIYDEECTSPWVEDTNLTPFLECFAALVASAERSACAKVADEYVGQNLEHNFSALIAHNIRTRSKHD